MKNWCFWHKFIWYHWNSTELHSQVLRINFNFYILKGKRKMCAIATKLDQSNFVSEKSSFLQKEAKEVYFMEVAVHYSYHSSIW